MADNQHHAAAHSVQSDERPQILVTSPYGSLRENLPHIPSRAMSARRFW